MNELKSLHEYFDYHWKQEPYSIIDHAMRVDRLPNGDFHFYVHPANTGGITSDFVVTQERVQSREEYEKFQNWRFPLVPGRRVVTLENGETYHPGDFVDHKHGQDNCPLCGKPLQHCPQGEYCSDEECPYVL